FYPSVARTTRVPREPDTHWHVGARAQRREQLEDRRRARKIARLLDVEPGVAVALIKLGVGVALQISELEASALRIAPCFFLLIVRPLERPVDHPAALDRVHQFGAGSPQHQPRGINPERI